MSNFKLSTVCRRNLFLIVFGLTLSIFVLVVAESLVRCIWKEPIPALVSDPILNHKWRPNSTFVHKEWVSRGLPTYQHSYNSQGLIANQDYQVSKAAGVFRLIYMGDSFTEGTVAMESSLPSRMTELLTPFFGKTGIKLELINAGTSSYSPLLYLLQYRHLLSQYSPNLLVVNIDMTDVFDDARYQLCAQYDRAGKLTASPECLSQDEVKKIALPSWQGPTLKERIIRIITKHSYFFRYLQSLMRNNSQPHPYNDHKFTEQFAWCHSPWSQQTENRVQFSMGLISDLIDQVRNDGHQIILSAAPHRGHLLGYWSSRPFEELKALAQRKNVPFLDVRQIMQDKISKDRLVVEDLFIPQDMHLNAQGYNLWAEAQYELLVQELALDSNLAQYYQ